MNGDMPKLQQGLDVLEKITEDLSGLPMFLTTQDLVDIGLYKNRRAVHMQHFRGKTPPCLYIGRKLLFPKAAIIDFVLTHMENPAEEDFEIEDEDEISRN